MHRSTVLEEKGRDGNMNEMLEWYEEQARLFGPAQHFGGDLFHEQHSGVPPGVDLKRASAAIQSAMRKATPDAVWVIQAWQENPRQEILDGTIPEATLILDLSGD